MSTPAPAELSAALARAKRQRAASLFSPLHPVLPEPGAELHPQQAVQLDAALAEANAWEAELLREVRRMRRYLSWSYVELCEEAQRIPARLRMLATAGASAAFDAARLVGLAERLFGIEVQGDSLQARVARVLDARFWRRTLRRQVEQEKELLHLRAGLVGKNASAYCSEDTVKLRATQRQAQARWLEEATLQAVIDGESVELPMAAVAKTAHQKLSRLYAFIAAMDRLAVENGLTVALLTATLESEWHPNPAHGKATHRWNGKSPTEASQELGARWQSVRRDLAKKGIALSGLWAAEPHRDGCPHRHLWLIYAPAHQREVFAAFLAYFPGKLKVRRDDGAGGDVVFETAADARAGVSRPLKRKREGAQVDVSIIDRDKGSGASYVIKYVSKSIGAEGVFDGDDAKPRTQRERRNLLAIDAYRALWGMRGCQFFGIQSCLGRWDELRRVQEPPAEPELRALWRAARGGDATGHVEAGEQRGDAYAFLCLLGGLAAAQAGDDAAPAEAAPQIRLYRSETLTQYGEKGQRIEGIELVRPGKGEDEVLERVPTHLVRWSMKPAAAAMSRSAKAKAKPPSKPAPADAAGDS